ncbi:uncharacterized protein N7459_006844 [Penicillium hispanicum]|uniref:uncharacterized protein n=1 Tax=Penicillium hispanicum TaxID=1080232 RepID=UPI002540B095|nr:uncharacterized protein N7459_006844 [Penicillium hispanicum]KAJ5577880.1 hypothetical protein N7459_006844 [Penicillium hispanicum]
MFPSSNLKRPRDESEAEPGVHDPKLPKLCPSWQAIDTRPDSSPDLDQALRVRAPTLTPVDSSDDDEDPQKGERSDSHATSPIKSAQGPRPPILQLSPDSHASTHLALLAGGDNLSPWLAGSHNNDSIQLSPIPHSMIKYSLTLGEAATPQLPPGYCPPAQFSLANQPLPDPNSMEDVSYSNEATHAAPPSRLPSPVSDGDATMGSGSRTPSSDAEMAFSSSRPASMALEFDHQPVPPADQSASHQLLADPMDQWGSSSLSTSPRKKPALVMGYRADCDKCQRRVPGHYNHILRA